MINILSGNLKNLRRKHGLTQEEVAEKTGVSRQAVAKWESGKTVPDINNCMILAKLYGVALDDLVNHAEHVKGNSIHPKGKHVFGIVKVGERGQIVIPKKARDIFGISSGDSLLVIGDESQGIAIVKHNHLLHFLEAVHHAEEIEE